MGKADLCGKALKALQRYFSLKREQASIRATRLRVEKHLEALRREVERDPALAEVLGADIKRLKQRQARLLCRELEAEEYCEYIEAALTAAGLGVEDRSMLVHRYRDNWTWTRIAVHQPLHYVGEIEPLDRFHRGNLFCFILPGGWFVLPVRPVPLPGEDEQHSFPGEN